MKRRNFLAMLGVAPLVTAVAKFSPDGPKRFWSGTTIPRTRPYSTGIVPVVVSPVVHGGVFSGVLEGEMSRAEAIQKGLEFWPDGAVRFCSGYIGWNPSEEDVLFLQSKFSSLSLRKIHRDFVRVEILAWKEGQFSDARIVGRGYMNRSDAIRQGISICPDDVVRISEMLWDNMKKEVKDKILARYHCDEKFYA